MVEEETLGSIKYKYNPAGLGQRAVGVGSLVGSWRRRVFRVGCLVGGVEVLRG